MLNAGLIAVLSLMAMPTSTQDSRGDTETDFQAPPPPPARLTPREGQTADTAAGRAGERRTRDQVDGVRPLARIDNRVQNRVQSRLRNRIDRNYDARANATSPFAVAVEATQRAGRRGRR